MSVRHSLFAAVAATTLGLAAAVASAASANTYVVVPSSGPTGYSSDGPAGAFAFDTDSARPGVANTAPAGFGDTSFNGSVSNSGATAADRYTTFRVNVATLFGHSVTVADLASLTYQTNSSGDLDWRPTIYTNKTGNTNPADPNRDFGSFYHSRLQADPLPVGDGNWHTVDSADLSWFDSHLEGGAQTGFATYSAIRSGSVTYTPTGLSRDFSTDTINFIDFTLGANSGGGNEAGAIDDINFTLANGDSVTLDLAAAPVPSAAYAALPLLALLAAPKVKLLKRPKTA